MYYICLHLQVFYRFFPKKKTRPKFHITSRNGELEDPKKGGLSPSVGKSPVPTAGDRSRDLVPAA